MKKYIASVLMLAMMVSLSMPVKAAGHIQNKDHYEEFEYVDDFGDRYHGFYARDDEMAEVAIYDEAGRLISRAIREQGSDLIIETISKKAGGEALESRSEEMETRITNINDYIIPVPEKQDSIANPASSASVEIDLPGKTYYIKNGTHNTDYLYQGYILKGDSYYRQNGDNYEYDRMSHKFVRNTSISAILIIVGGVYGWATKSVIEDILFSAGVGVAGVALTTDWVFNGCAMSFGYDIQCRMKYNGANVIMSQIERSFEYLVVEDEKGNVLGYYFDDFEYSSPATAIRSWCNEAVGYGAKAFNIKYIAGTDPSLHLPVTGPIY